MTINLIAIANALSWYIVKTQATGKLFVSICLTEFSLVRMPLNTCTLSTLVHSSLTQCRCQRQKHPIIRYNCSTMRKFKLDDGTSSETWKKNKQYRPSSVSFALLISIICALDPLNATRFCVSFVCFFLFRFDYVPTRLSNILTQFSQLFLSTLTAQKHKIEKNKSMHREKKVRNKNVLVGNNQNKFYGKLFVCVCVCVCVVAHVEDKKLNTS